jgi:hypothetical protein
MLAVGVLALSSIVLFSRVHALQNYKQFLTGECANAMTAVETYGPDPYEFVTFNDQREARQIFLRFVNFLNYSNDI